MTTTTDYFKAVESSDALLAERQTQIRQAEDAGLLTPREAAELRCNALAGHLASCRDARQRYGIGALSDAAIERLRFAGFTADTWAAEHFGSAQWFGDSCGCPDGRCDGYHHGAGEECGCLSVLLSEAIAARVAGSAL
jgi:hypothetical protein